ncbi:hypothetical protein [Actinomadura chibensis]|uniref:Uncharacterized protein n=1 Tax=Actinomadura chibensis TaxID=392828 RepID=A0A5D0NHG7_9ACTN|nr:hypothetical protein [Actinomadura chibensis]TYB43867.1 hypothetical protein FXF69_23125 [Actinomadura chibensis]
MSQAAHPSGEEAVGARTTLDPAVQAVARIVDAYAPPQASTFLPHQWKGLQADPYALRRESDALADREDLDLELMAIGIAAQAIALGPELHRIAMATRGRVRCHTSMGVSWIMMAAPPATGSAAYITACRLLAQAGATDQQLRRRGLLLSPPQVAQSA